MPRIREVSKATLGAVRALASFKPRKSDRGSFVFLSPTGKRQAPTSRRKGIFVYVNAKGRVEPLREKPRRPLGLHPASSFDIPRTNKKKAVEKFYKSRKFHKNSKSTLFHPQTTEKKTGISYLRFSRSLSRQIKSFIEDSRDHGTIFIDVSFTVKTSDGETKTYNQIIQFNQTRRQFLTLADYENFVRKEVYAAIAENLKRHGMVATGSAAHIRSLAVNKGEHPEDWLDRQGQPWEKQDLARAKIVRMEYRLRKNGI